VQLFVAELRGRARGLEGEALERECDRFLDRMIERQVAVAPERLKERVRETLRELLSTDPAFVALRGDLRAAARRGV
jgi:predicted component of type VI protein secretion system